jgi:hypothetical protein
MGLGNLEGRSVKRTILLAWLSLISLGLDLQAQTPAQDAAGQGTGEDVGALAKAAQNPVANLISVPFQDNINFDVGPGDDVQNVLNIQPVIPVHLSEQWNLITRTIMPVICQPELGPELPEQSGLGDIQFTAFLSPAKPGKWIWGVGPIFQFPSATDEVLGQGKWCAGPSAVVLRSEGPWLYGALINNVWSFAGHEDRGAVNQMILQPFVNYNLPEGWYVVSAPILTANWKADSDQRWVVPLGAGVGRIFKLGRQPVNAQVQGFYNVVHPDNGPDWQLRAQVQLLFPSK